MHVLICNERLLARFGVDRLLLMFARELVRQGHRVTFCAMRYDRQAVEHITPFVYQIDGPADLDLFGTDRAACEVAESLLLGPKGERPDVAVVGGWPFFGMASRSRRFGLPTVFIDAGAVPTEGYGAEMRAIQQQLRRLRALSLPAFTRVLPISRFIEETQTLPERGRADGVRVVLLGADHLEQPLFTMPETSEDAFAGAVLARAAKADDKLLLALGRFESEGYKNSAAVFEVFRMVRESVPESRLLLLARAGEVAVPPDLAEQVVHLGFPGDAALQDIMRGCAAGISTSLWEGFNLPLAEMQWLGRPALAFNVGAHPEVVVNPWFLCANTVEISRKAALILQGEVPTRLTEGGAYDRFRRNFRWSDVFRRWMEELAGLGGDRASAEPNGRSPRPLLIDVTCASADPANPGVIRVTRQLSARLARDPDLLCAFVWWDTAACNYRGLDEHRRRLLADFGGPAASETFSSVGPQTWLDVTREREAGSPLLLLPEVILDGSLPERLAWARARRMSVAAILYDLIPITHAPLCGRDVVRAFPEYLESLSAADLLLAISRHTLDAFQLHTARRGGHQPCASALWLPGQFGSELREQRARAESVSGPTKIVCVSTVEPRKNHRVLIGGFRRALGNARDVTLTLELIGNSYAGAEDLASWVRAAAADEPRVMWSGSRPDAAVATALKQAAFSVYPSLTEGFGLPVLESLWLGCPVVCHNAGVMAELAAGGGCLTVDMSDEAEVADALARMATDAGLRRELTTQALARPIGDWAWYATEVKQRLLTLP